MEKLKPMKKLKPKKTLHFTRKGMIAAGCTVLVLLLTVLLLCLNFRYYPAEEVSAYYEEYWLYNPHHKDHDAPVQAVIACRQSSAFKKAEGMTPDEVHKKWGMPHAGCGSGRYMEAYFTADGYLVILGYSDHASDDTTRVSDVTTRKL